MNTINLTGQFALNELNLVDPIITVEDVKYNYPSMNVTVNVTLRGDNYEHNRDLKSVPFTTALTESEIEDVVTDALNNRLNTPPAPNGYGIVIPSDYQWAFPIEIAGYTCELKDLNGTKYVDASYLTWKPFLDEFDKDLPGYKALKKSLLPIFTYAKTDPEIIVL